MTDRVKFVTVWVKSMTDRVKSVTIWVKSTTDWVKSVTVWVKSETDRVNSATVWVKSVTIWVKSMTDLTQSATDFTQSEANFPGLQPVLEETPPPCHQNRAVMSPSKFPARVVSPPAMLPGTVIIAMPQILKLPPDDLRHFGAGVSE
jgi:hypothetical protein